MPPCVLLLGGECTGKSALAESVAASTGGVVVPELLRRFVDVRGRGPRQHEQKQILQDQYADLQTAMQAADPSQLVISDPAPLMTAVYSIQYFDDSSLLGVALEAYSPKGALWVWCQPDIPWVEDALHRDGPKTRAATHEVIEDHVISLLHDQRLIEARGSTVERTETVLAALNS